MKCKEDIKRLHPKMIMEQVKVYIGILIWINKYLSYFIIYYYTTATKGKLVTMKIAMKSMKETKKNWIFFIQLIISYHSITVPSSYATHTLFFPFFTFKLPFILWLFTFSLFTFISILFAERKWEIKLTRKRKQEEQFT